MDTPVILALISIGLTVIGLIYTGIGSRRAELARLVDEHYSEVTRLKNELIQLRVEMADMRMNYHNLVQENVELMRRLVSRHRA